MARQQFKVGDSVEWVSTHGGSSIQMDGKVCAVIPMGQPPKPVYQAMQQTAQPELWKFSYHGGEPRGHESYLVMVRKAGKTPTVYWPVAAKLSAVKGVISASNVEPPKEVFEITPKSIRDTY